MTTIRPESADDVDTVRYVIEQAFGRPDEAALVDALRAQARPFVSLVAVESERVVGHIAFSPVTIEGSGPAVRAAGLGPMAVSPERQRRGVGALLVRAGLSECRRAGFDAVVVVGHPAYYPRFGFTPAGAKGLRCEYDVPDEAFMAVGLRPGALDGGAGLVKYHAAFGAV